MLSSVCEPFGVGVRLHPTETFIAVQVRPLALRPSSAAGERDILGLKQPEGQTQQRVDAMDADKEQHAGAGQWKCLDKNQVPLVSS